jgi:hypothetical protein
MNTAQKKSNQKKSNQKKTSKKKTTKKAAAKETLGLEIDTGDKNKKFVFKDIEFMGADGVRVQFVLNSNGLMCDRPFEFDNDEYFLAKLKELQQTGQGDAELTHLYSDEFIKFETPLDNRLSIIGFLSDGETSHQTLEFAFDVDIGRLDQLIIDFEKLVRANIG